MIRMQTCAILMDACRGLKARKMFWIVLGLSALMVLVFASLGIDETGMKFLKWTFSSSPNTNHMSPAEFYKSAFTGIGLSIWLGWIASVLALISTAGIFPSLVSSGSIDLVLSRPIGRLRLFLTQYAAGLLFVVLQASVFCAGSFLLIGIRGGEWELGLFLGIPLVVCLFSYLFSVCVFWGLVTRSTVAALLLTLLFWGFLYAVHTAETGLLFWQNEREERAARVQWEADSLQAQLAELEKQPPDERTDEAEQKLADMGTRISDLRKARSDALSVAGGLRTGQKIVYAIKSFLPKTEETIGLTQRVLVRFADLPDSEGGQNRGGQSPPGPIDPRDQRTAANTLVKEMRTRSVWWVLGTSLAFELVVLALSARIFCRRDY